AGRHGERGVRERGFGRRGAVGHDELAELLGGEFLAATAVEQSSQASDLVALLHELGRELVTLLADRLKLGFDELEEPGSVAHREQADDAISQRLPFVVGVVAHASSVPEPSPNARMNDSDFVLDQRVSVTLPSLHDRCVDPFEQHHQSSDVELDELTLVGRRSTSKRSRFEPLHPNAEAVAVPIEHANLRCASVEEHEEVAPTQRMTEVPLHQRGEAVIALPQVGRLRRHEHPSGPRSVQHDSKTSTNARRRCGSTSPRMRIVRPLPRTTSTPPDMTRGPSGSAWASRTSMKPECSELPVGERRCSQLHRYRVSALNPRAFANSRAVWPLARHSSSKHLRSVSEYLRCLAMTGRYTKISRLRGTLPVKGLRRCDPAEELPGASSHRPRAAQGSGEPREHR